MKWLNATSDPGGWKDYEFTLVESDGQPLLVADEIVRAYIGYVSECRSNNETELSFGDWMSDISAQEPASAVL